MAMNTKFMVNLLAYSKHSINGGYHYYYQPGLVRDNVLQEAALGWDLKDE